MVRMGKESKKDHSWSLHGWPTRYERKVKSSRLHSGQSGVQVHSGQKEALLRWGQLPRVDVRKGMLSLAGSSQPQSSPRLILGSVLGLATITFKSLYEESHLSWLKRNLTPANFSHLFSFETIRRVFWQHWSREQWRSPFGADLGCTWAPKLGCLYCLLGSHTSHSVSLYLEIKGKTWRTGSKLESLYRQGSLIIVLLLEIFLELVFRVMCGRQERCHLPLSKLGPKEFNKSAYPF